MDPRNNKFLEELEKEKFVILSERELKYLLESSDIIKEADTLVSDYVRILFFRDHFLFQETTKHSKIIIRHFKTRKEAEELLNRRMEIYEKMWNGCGCKVKYYE